MSVRSDILIHWTKPKLPPEETNGSTIIETYVELIKSIYSKGLKFSIPEKKDEVYGAGTWTQIPTIPMICFTELRLSDVAEHTKRYGRMGIGFERSWLMRYRGANPVFYVQNGDQGVVNTNLFPIIHKSDSIPALNVFLSFIKPMSEASDSKSLIYYDEMEWRMVLWRFIRNGVTQPDPDWVCRDGSTAYFRFLANDVAIIIAPDEETRQAMLRDPEMRECFEEYLPMIVTAERCNYF